VIPELLEAGGSRNAPPRQKINPDFPPSSTREIEIKVSLIVTTIYHFIFPKSTYFMEMGDWECK